MVPRSVVTSGRPAARASRTTRGCPSGSTGGNRRTDEDSRSLRFSSAVPPIVIQHALAAEGFSQRDLDLVAASPSGSGGSSASAQPRRTNSIPRRLPGALALPCCRRLCWPRFPSSPSYWST